LSNWDIWQTAVLINALETFLSLIISRVWLLFHRQGDFSRIPKTNNKRILEREPTKTGKKPNFYKKRGRKKAPNSYIWYSRAILVQENHKF
jgi:hypothetical protein